MTRRIRTNGLPIRLSSARQGPQSNVILAYYRDTHDNVDSVLELLWATQLLRLAYDSPKIGGGLDPEVARLGAGDSISNEREEPGSLLNYIMGTMEEPTDALTYMPLERIQEHIVHAEAVALLWLAVFENDT